MIVLITRYTATTCRQSRSNNHSPKIKKL